MQNYDNLWTFLACSQIDVVMSATYKTQAPGTALFLAATEATGKT